MRRAERAGAALLAVLCSLTLTSALVVGGAYVARRAATASALSARGSSLDPWAEEALVRAIAGWDTTGRNELGLGETAQLGRRLSEGVEVLTTATRVGQRTWWLVADATSHAKPLLHRKLGVLVRMDGGDVAPVPDRAWMELP